MARKPYDLGYRKPPQHSRFKPGQSGNPKGRPKGSKNLKTVVQEEMRRPIVINEGGKPTRVTRREALIKMLMNKGLKGDHKATATMIQLDHQVNNEVTPVLVDEALNQEDQAILDDFLARASAATSPKLDPESGEDA